MLNVLYEDNHIIVIVKPQNVPTQEDETGDTDMLTLVKCYIKEKYNKPGNVYTGLVHRLDRPTGGVMVFAKTSKAASRLSAQIKSGEFEKTYLTIVKGEPRSKYGRLTHYLKKDEKENKVYVTPQTDEGSKLAELDYRTIGNKNGMSLISVNLLTGRSHQIRVQFAAIGCPVAGDSKYGKEAKTTTHLALYASILKFNHPTTNKRMTFIAYPPEEKPWTVFDIKTLFNMNVSE